MIEGMNRVVDYNIKYHEVNKSNSTDARSAMADLENINAKLSNHETNYQQ
jgi:hypothetical protein